MSRHRAPGRRRAPGAVRRLPDGLSRLGRTWAVKSVATVGVVGGAAVALALPVDASPAALSLPVAATTASQTRVDALAASRSAGRVQAPAPAVSKPKPKPKPKPQPKPTPTATAESKSGTASSSARSYSTSITAKCSSIGLNNDAARLCSAVQSAFGLTNIGGYRPNAGEHSTGQAVDFMISSQSQGDAIAAFVQNHVSEFNVQYIIWRQRYWEPGSSWELMEDRGSITQNHYDHVHVTVD